MIRCRRGDRMISSADIATIDPAHDASALSQPLRLKPDFTAGYLPIGAAADENLFRKKAVQLDVGIVCVSGPHAPVETMQLIVTLSITRNNSAIGSMTIISGTAISYERPKGRSTTARGESAAMPLSPSVANEATVAKTATMPRSSTLKERPMSVPMNSVATIK